jgi:hypothetical protein
MNASLDIWFFSDNARARDLVFAFKVIVVTQNEFKAKAGTYLFFFLENYFC